MDNRKEEKQPELTTKEKITEVQTKIIAGATTFGVLSERMRLAKNKQHKQKIHAQRDITQVEMLENEEKFWDILGL